MRRVFVWLFGCLFVCLFFCRLRREVYGDDCLGSSNLHMAAIAHKYNSVGCLGLAALPPFPFSRPPHANPGQLCLSRQ
jgi:hypothetical protein